MNTEIAEGSNSPEKIKNRSLGNAETNRAALSISFSVARDKLPVIILLHFSGDAYLADCPLMQHALNMAIEKGRLYFVLDFSAVGTVDDSVWEYLYTTLEEIEDCGGFLFFSGKQDRFFGGNCDKLYPYFLKSTPDCCSAIRSLIDRRQESKRISPNLESGGQIDYIFLDYTKSASESKKIRRQAEPMSAESLEDYCPDSGVAKCEAGSAQDEESNGLKSVNFVQEIDVAEQGDCRNGEVASPVIPESEEKCDNCLESANLERETDATVQEFSEKDDMISLDIPESGHEYDNMLECGDLEQEKEVEIPESSGINGVIPPDVLESEEKQGNWLEINDLEQDKDVTVPKLTERDDVISPDVRESECEQANKLETGELAQEFEIVAPENTKIDESRASEIQPSLEEDANQLVSNELSNRFGIVEEECTQTDDEVSQEDLKSEQMVQDCLENETNEDVNQNDFVGVDTGIPDPVLSDMHQPLDTVIFVDEQSEAEDDQHSITPFITGIPEETTGITAKTLYDKIEAIIAANGPCTFTTIKKLLSTKEYGFAKVSVIQLFSILKEMNLDTKSKRLRFYRSC